MTAKELLEELRKLTAAERLLVIDELARMTRDEWPAPTISLQDDPILRDAGCIDADPYLSEQIDTTLYGHQ
ncbi:MAG: hypothetical protein K2Y37_10570 [Pirellulales bacterium]|nr:hypothetical protein [Pirellulales bacterium]